jgi:uncharacterized membrane protein
MDMNSYANPIAIAIYFVIYFGLAVIATFFNVCTVYTVKKRFEGGNATPSESIGFAFSKFGKIVGWSLIAATVGIILRLLDQLAEKFGTIGEIVMKILVRLMGAAWSFITIFVVPIMVYKDIGPIDAVKMSVQTLKTTWGESLIGGIGLGLIQLLIMVGIIIAGVGLIFVSAIFGFWGVISALIILMLALLFTFLLFSAANSVYKTALFVYAEKGSVPNFDNELLKNSFQIKPERKMF